MNQPKFFASINFSKFLYIIYENYFFKILLCDVVSPTPQIYLYKLIF